MSEELRSQLAPTGVLRAGVNLGNILLVTGTTEAGDPTGVSPDMARAIADRLEVPVSYVAFPSPGQVADAISDDVWDIALIANEPERAETITFSPAYVEIEATYLVPESSSAESVEEVDAADMRIAVSARSAYDLYLDRTLRHAQLVRGEGLDGALELFASGQADALAGLRPALVENARTLPGTRVRDGRFTTIRQAIGVRPQHAAAAGFLARLVRELRDDGTIQGFMDRHGVGSSLRIGSDS